MEEINAFVKVLVKTSPMTSEDVQDLRNVFNFFKDCGESGFYIGATQAARILRKFGLPNVKLEWEEDKLGLRVQPADRPKLLLNEQEFLLLAARLFREEYRDLLENGYLDLDPEKIAVMHAARLFRSYDPNETGKIPFRDLKFGLMNMGCSNVNDQAAADFCDYLGEMKRVLDLEDDDERFVSFHEFVSFFAPVVQSTTGPT